MAKVKPNLSAKDKPGLLRWQAECPADWASDPRTVTVLRTKNIPATKEYEFRDGKYHKAPPRKLPDGRTLHAQQYHVQLAQPNNLAELAAVLIAASEDPCNLVVRGYVVDSPKTRKQTIARDQQTIRDAARHWFMNDLDGFPLPTEFDWCVDLARTAKWAVETYLTEFANVAFVYQFSASAGIKPGLRLHLWWWLETPTDSQTLFGHFGPIAGKLSQRHKTAELEAALDTAVMNPIQEHFIAKPIISGPDPLNGHPRQALVEGAHLTLVLRTTNPTPSDNPLVRDAQTPEEQKTLSSQGWQPSLEDVAGMIPFVVQGYGALCASWKEAGQKWSASPWRKAITALKHHLMLVLEMEDKKAFQWVEENFSEKLPDYDAEKYASDNRRTWEQTAIDRPVGPGGQVTIGTFIRWASDSGWKASNNAKASQQEAAVRQAQAVVEETQKRGWLFCIASTEFYCESPFQKLSKEQFSAKYAPMKVKGFRTVAEQCLAMDTFPRIDAYTFDPRTGERFIKEDGLQKLNLYRPNIITAQPGDVQRFLDHAKYILPDEKQRHILLQVMAFHIQHPGEKIRWALILYGRVQRTGKSYFGQVERKILGHHNVRTVTNERLHEPWTDWQEGAQLVIVEELKGSGSRYEILNKLKPMITEPIASVRYPGGKVAYDMPNRYNFLMFTNHQDALPLDLSDMRYCILSSPAEREDNAYYNGQKAVDGSWIDGLWEWTDKNIAAIKYFLEHYSLEGFNQNGEAPRTQAFLDMVERGDSALDEWLKGSIANQTGLFFCDLIVIEDLLEILPPSLKKEGIRRNRMATALEKAEARRAGRAQLGKAGYPNVWSIRNHEQWFNEGEGTRGKYYLTMLKSVIGDMNLEFQSPDAIKSKIRPLGTSELMRENAVKKAGEDAM